MSHATARRALLWLIPALIAGGAAVDQHFAGWGQPVVSAMVWAVFAALLGLESAERRIALCLCLVIATLGEVFLSLVWGLYDYRLHNIPLFVPPGHVLLFWFGMQTASRVPGRLLDAVPVLSGIASVGLLISGIDALSLALWGLFVLACVLGRLWRVSSTRFYSWMFVLALVMEVFATRVGNWSWRPTVPVLGWSTLNPPLAAGAFYCMLDLLVFAAAARLSRFSLRPARGAAP
ncbi:hypothetical protein [Viridibacterium curvum]|uniref:Integral membrane protein n=1 Tax=Viridibacterium curvum TaxID=1101404 RepID=A0ABP9QGM2_9RHOO